jgi:DNA-binding SARP family transcriptional activator
MGFPSVRNALQLSEYTNQLKVESHWPVLICLLGGFRILLLGQPVLLRNPIKTKALLASLVLEEDHCITRDALLLALWPDTDTYLASQSLNSLVHKLRKLLSDNIGGQPPILRTDSCYRLNIDAGIGVDAVWFETLASTGEKQRLAGDFKAATASFKQAVYLYHGDLDIGTDTRSLVLIESLRAQYLTLLARLADYYYTTDDYSSCLNYALHMLSVDPCREDAHRIVMQCFMRQGERAQALRQYRICEGILRSEFDVAPESTTTALFEQIRLDPSCI